MKNQEPVSKRCKWCGTGAGAGDGCTGSYMEEQQFLI
jgi:hypothetical protein